MNPVKIKTLYVFNREIWPELLTQKDELSKLGSLTIGNPPVNEILINYSDSVQATINFSGIPFEGSYIPYAWIQQNIIPLADSSIDQIVFHMPTDQWKGGATNGFTLAGHGKPTVICVHSHQGEQLFDNPSPIWKDRGFYERTQHEFAHAYCDIKGIQDFYIAPDGSNHWKVHDIEDAGGLWRQPWFEYIGLVQVPMSPDTLNKYTTVISGLQGIIAALTAKIAALVTNKKVIVQKPTPNQMVGRSGFKPEAIVLHIMDGTLSGTDSWFASSKSMVSSHYGFGKNGEIHQYVKEENTAWHAGLVLNPTWELIKVGVSPNLYTLGFEHEGTSVSVWSDAMKNASAGMIKDCAKRWDIPLDRKHILGHYEIAGAHRPDCPAKDKAIIDELLTLAINK